MIDLKLGDCRERLRELPDNSVDSIVTDPPYELGFMGKGWDKTGIAYDPVVWTQCLRVLKPGGHLLAFGGTRTYHRMVCAIEDAGFEIRDEVLWIYGSGFPKSLNVGKAIEGLITTGSSQKNNFHKLNGERTGDGRIGMYDTVEAQGFRKVNPDQLGAFNLDPTTDEAKQWQGWGTGLKPAHEPICLARKPLEGTVAANVLKYGVGGLNIDGCRVGTANDLNPSDYDDSKRTAPKFNGRTYASGRVDVLCGRMGQVPQGRWPANLITDGSEEVVKMFPQTKGGTWNRTDGARPFNNDGKPTGYQTSVTDDTIGSAARFFYSAKASPQDRDEGLEGFEKVQQDESRKEGNPGGDNPRNRGVHKRANPHPTVKPTSLMRYLCRLVTPKGGTVLDPFMGSGSTGKAAQMEGFNFIGIELDPYYLKIAKARIESVESLFTGGVDDD